MNTRTSDYKMEVRRFPISNMKRRLLYALLAASSFFALGASAETAIIGIGESVRLEIQNASKIHISDGGIVRARSPRFRKS